MQPSHVHAPFLPSARPSPDGPAMDLRWRRYPSARQTAAQAWSSGCGPVDGGLPPVFLTDADYADIERLFAAYLCRDYPVVSFLARELDRARIMGPDEIPADVVTMNSRVVFRSDAEAEPVSRVLTFPPDCLSPGRHVSVMSPLGAALLGLREGARIEFNDMAGASRWVRIDMVAFQPEAHRRRTGVASE